VLDGKKKVELKSKIFQNKYNKSRRFTDLIIRKKSFQCLRKRAPEL